MKIVLRVLASMTFVASACVWVTIAHAGTDDYTVEIQRWQQARIAKLTSADSWLGVTNADTLQRGASRIGSGANEDVVLPEGPSHLGVLTYSADGTLSLSLADKSHVSIDHAPTVAGRIEPIHVDGLYFEPDGALTAVDAKGKHAAPTTVHVGSATLKFYSYDGATNHGDMRLVVTDPQAPVRSRLKSLDYFPIDASWKVTAHWEPLKTPRDIDVAYVHGNVSKDRVLGKVVFDRDGKTYELLPYMRGDDGEMMFVFADRTSGKETYGGARFLFASASKDGKVILDFNKAVNPPCALIPFPNCPIASPENRLALRVTAGEKTVHD